MASGRHRSGEAKPEDEGGHMFRFKPQGFKGMPKHEFAG